jgi:hypothetical protein
MTNKENHVHNLDHLEATQADRIERLERMLETSRRQRIKNFDLAFKWRERAKEQESEIQLWKLQVETERKRCDQYEEKCGDCGGGGENLIGMDDVVVCSTCNGTGKQRVYVLPNELINATFCDEYDGQYEWRWNNGAPIQIIEHTEDGDEKILYTLTRTDTGDWRVEQSGGGV